MAEAILSPDAAALATLHELSKTAKVHLYKLALKPYAVDGERRLVLLPLPTLPLCLLLAGPRSCARYRGTAAATRRPRPTTARLRVHGGLRRRYCGRRCRIRKRHGHPAASSIR